MTLSVWFVVGVVWSITTVSTTGGALPTLALSLTIVPFVVPSFGVTSTVTVSPLLPLPACDRSKVSVRLEEFEVVCGRCR